jgi:hypothetical protein
MNPADAPSVLCTLRPYGMKWESYSTFVVHTGEQGGKYEQPCTSHNTN